MPTSKFSFCIMNPPYSGSIHLDFNLLGVKLIKDSKSKMTIIEPATWLININPFSQYNTGKGKNQTPDIKKLIDGHVSKVIIENYNFEFNTKNHVPFSIVYIDFSKKYDTIEYYRFGEKLYVKSIYDCNLIAPKETLNNIISKINAVNIDKAVSHIYDDTKTNITDNTYFCKCSQIIKTVAGNQAMAVQRGSNSYEWDTFFFDTKFGTYAHLYIAPMIHWLDMDITNTIQKSRRRGSGKDDYSDKDATCLYGTYDEMINWKHFVLNNKLSLFISLCMSIDQHNNVLQNIPWLVDKQYTDDEINKLFNFDDNEIKLINNTIKKFEKNSPWFKRYMCGKDSVSNEEVQKFIDNLINEEKF